MDWTEKLDGLNETQRVLARHLGIYRDIRQDCKRGGFTYSCAEDFVLQHGEWFTPNEWTTPTMEGPPKSCYAHSLRLCAHHQGLTYVEGFALLSEDLLLPLPHAWVTDTNGRLIDGTWRNSGVAYLGVRFSFEQALDSLQLDGSVLDCPLSKFEIFRHRFQAA